MITYFLEELISYSVHRSQDSYIYTEIFTSVHGAWIQFV